jgi:hypothetical protein
MCGCFKFLFQSQYFKRQKLAIPGVIIMFYKAPPLHTLKCFDQSLEIYIYYVEVRQHNFSNINYIKIHSYLRTRRSSLIQLAPII